MLFVRKTIEKSSYVQGDMNNINLLWFMTLYFILLPYAFLMNTKHNKNRVVEDGWQGVFKNIFRICSTGVPKPEKDIVNLDQNNDSRASRPSDEVSSKQTKITGDSNILGTPVLKAISTCNKLENNGVKIFSISQHEHLCDPMKRNSNMLALNVPMDEQPCSSNMFTLNVPIDEQACSRNLRIENISINSSSDEEEFVPCTNDLMYTRYEMLTQMLPSLTRDENIYIEKFKEFVSFEEMLKTGKSTSKFIHTWSRKKGNLAKNNANDFNNSNEFKHPDNTCFDAEMEECYKSANLEFIEYSREKIKIRQKSISCLLRHYHHDETTYHDLLEEFINLEEDFVA